MSFPSNFVWGVATASYQIEGTPLAAGGGASIWDQFSRRPHATLHGETGDVACDHYQRWREDVALMQDLGVHAYRFSLSWPRILPEGTGAINQIGLDFYDRLVDALLAAHITPYVTLFHWDYPAALYARGGWLSPDSPHWFADYTRLVVERLSDRVTHWMTHNEPQCFIGLGHRVGQHAPGEQWDWPLVLQAGHHALIAHGKAVQTIRAYAKHPCQVGIASVGVVAAPATMEPADIAAAQHVMFSMPDDNPWNNTWWLDPIFLGHYPDDGLQVYGNAVPPIGADDMATIRQPLDFLGANIYNCQYVRATAEGQPHIVPHSVDVGRSMYYWPVTPEALYWGPRFYYERYHTPIAITENGITGMDWVALDGKVHDPQRRDFLTRYLRELRRACADGIDISAYFHWALLDNFEWQEGYRQRFGLVHVNYQTQQRTIKDSGYWFHDVIQTNGAILDDD